jgi:hypothetical protein
MKMTDESFKTHETIVQIQSGAEEPSQPQESDWYYAEGIPGTGEKPDWFNNKTFKTIEEQAKASLELRKALGERTAAPEKYEINLGEDYKDFKFNQEDQLYKFWEDFSKEAKLPQELFSKGLQAWADYIKGMENERGETFKKSIDELGIGYDETLNKIENWFKNNFPKQSFESFKLLLQTPDDINMVLAMKDKMQSSQITTKDTKGSTVQDREYWRMQMSKENDYGINIPKTRQIDESFQKFIDSGGKI